jgi:hypothetical protein
MGDYERYIWTLHSKFKMKYYGISESRVKRIINFPDRVEEGIVKNTIAAMQKSGSKKKYQEIWVMYTMEKSKKLKSGKEILNKIYKKPKIKIITAWRYPGKSPERNPIPEEILREVRNIL